MNVIYEYTITSMRKNRGSSISVMVAVLMVTTMMSALCGFLYNIYADNMGLVLKETGNWHGELFDNTSGISISTVEGFDSVESIMVKGKWKVAQIGDPRREYLIYRDANSEYWASMPEGGSITEGRAPSKPGEIALSKQYFEHHPELKIGDILILPEGERVTETGDVIDPTDRLHAREKFRKMGEVRLTVTGKLDVTTSSVVPAYTALGYLSMDSVADYDQVTIYLRFKNVRDTYRDLPRIAEAVGFKKDEYGRYDLRYNTDYLARLLIFSPEQKEAAGQIDKIAMPLTYMAIGLITVGIFVLIIHNAFALSANSRLTQIGILASIGATPKQIKKSVMFEAFLLSIIPMPVGLTAGQLLVKALLDTINAKNIAIDVEPVVFTVGSMSIVPAIILTLATVWWSSLIPAKKVAKMSPITAIKQGENGKLKKIRHHGIFRVFGIEGELAGNAVRARSYSYLTATASLMLSILVLCGVMFTSTASRANEEIYDRKAYLKEEGDIYLSLYSARNQSDREIMDEIAAIDEVESAVWSADLKAALWLTDDMFSEEFNDAGGYAAASRVINTRYILERDGQYRVPAVLVGLDREAFAAFCSENGIDKSDMTASDKPFGILLNSIEDVTVSTLRNPVSIPYLNIKAGESIEFTEKRSDDTTGDYTFEVKVISVTDTYPPIARRNLTSRYGITVFMPMEMVDKLAASFVQGGIDTVHGVFKTDTHDRIKQTASKIESKCESWFGSGDYYMNNEIDYEENNQNGRQMMNFITAFITGLLAVIGLSNVWATVTGNLNSRAREFAVLRSVGIPPTGIYKMLALEGLFLAATPILLVLPFCTAILILLLNLNELSLAQWLPYSPLQAVAAYVICLVLSILASYILGAKKLLKHNIIDTVKTDTI